MLRKTDQIDPRIIIMVDELRAALSLPADGTVPDDLTLIYASPVDPKARQVWRLTLDGKPYALKLDFDAGPDGRLTKEHRELAAMAAHFDAYDKIDLITPVYLSPSGRFCVSDYVDFRTAGDRLASSDSAGTKRQVFRRAGLWLTAMHDYQPVRKKAFWGNWMPIELDEIVARDEMQADPADVAAYRAILKKQIRLVNKVRDSHAWSHGDYHADNLMLGPGVTYGLDFTEARRKMAVYDIVDFLKCDVVCDTPRAELDGAGITKVHREMFLKGYKHPINPDILDVALRGRMLIDWAAVRRTQYARAQEDRTRFEQMKYRLDVAFGVA